MRVTSRGAVTWIGSDPERLPPTTLCPLPGHGLREYLRDLSHGPQACGVTHPPTIALHATGHDPPRGAVRHFGQGSRCRSASPSVQRFLSGGAPSPAMALQCGSWVWGTLTPARTWRCVGLLHSLPDRVLCACVCCVALRCVRGQVREQKIAPRRIYKTTKCLWLQVNRCNHLK